MGVGVIITLSYKPQSFIVPQFNLEFRGEHSLERQNDDEDTRSVRCLWAYDSRETGRCRNFRWVSLTY